MTTGLSRLRTSDGLCRHCGRYGRRWCWYPEDGGADYYVISGTECCSAACYRCKAGLGQCPAHEAKGA